MELIYTYIHVRAYVHTYFYALCHSATASIFQVIVKLCANCVRHLCCNYDDDDKSH